MPALLNCSRDRILVCPSLYKCKDKKQNSLEQDKQEKQEIQEIQKIQKILELLKLKPSTLYTISIIAFFLFLIFIFGCTPLGFTLGCRRKKKKKVYKYEHNTNYKSLSHSPNTEDLRSHKTPYHIEYQSA